MHGRRKKKATSDGQTFQISCWTISWITCTSTKSGPKEMDIKIGMSCPSWQWHRTGYCWLPVQTLPVAPLWCDLRNCSPTVVAINLCLMNFHHFAWEIRAEKLWQSHFDVLKVNKKPWCCWIETSDRYAWARGMWFQSKKTKRKTKLSKSHHLTF